MMLYPEECILNEPLIFDTHAHYDDPRFEDCIDQLFDKLFSSGICGIVTCGCDKASSERALKLASAHKGVFAAVGIHPENIESGTSIDDIRRLAGNEKCVAIGETGLDYHYGSPKEPQIKLFEEQLCLSKELDLPIIVHDRDAHADTLALLKKHRPKGVVHCFSGSVEMAEEILRLGMYIGVGGVATFKNARKLPEVIKTIPEDKLLLETDAPYLAPEPYRGKLCHSGFIALTAERVAEIRGTSRDTLLKACCKNAVKLFGL